MGEWLVTYKRVEVREIAIEAPTLEAAKKVFDAMSLAPAGRLCDWEQDSSAGAIWEPISTGAPRAAEPADHAQPALDLPIPPAGPGRPRSSEGLRW